MLRHLLPPLAVLVHLTVSAQYFYPDEDVAKLINEKTLAVQLLAEESEVEIAMNSVLKEAFDTYFSGKVRFMLPKEFSSQKKKKNIEFAYLSQPRALREQTRMDIRYVDGSMKNWVEGATETSGTLGKQEVVDFEYERLTFDYYPFELSVFDRKRERMATSIGFVNDQLGKHDYVFLVQQIEWLTGSAASGLMRAEYVDVQQNIEELRSLKSYFLADFFEQEVIDEFDDYCEHPYEIVDFAAHQQLILDRKDGAAYMKFIFSYQHNKYLWVMVRASDGWILAVNEIGDYKFTGTFDVKNLIKPRHISMSVDENNQLLNNYYNK